MSPPLLVLDGAPPSELKSGIVNSTRVSLPLPGVAVRNETERAVGGFPHIAEFFLTVFPARN
jgi:hypothetical protein